MIYPSLLLTIPVCTLVERWINEFRCWWKLAARAPASSKLSIFHSTWIDITGAPCSSIEAPSPPGHDGRQMAQTTSQRSPTARRLHVRCRQISVDFVLFLRAFSAGADDAINHWRAWCRFDRRRTAERTRQSPAAAVEIRHCFTKRAHRGNRNLSPLHEWMRVH